MYKKLGLDPKLDYSKAAIGVTTVIPSETAIIMADIAMKASGIEIGFVDRFSGSLIYTGTVSEVEAAMAAQLEYVSRAKQGVTLPAEKKAPEQKSAGAQLEFLSPTLCQITLTEGKFHEVRRLFQALGNEVVELKRLSFGNYKLPQDLNPGEFRAVGKLL